MSDVKYAAALKYDIDSDEAPKLLAKGKGYVAEKMIEVARASDTSVYKDERLAKQLQNLEAGDQIPADLYEVVAEVLIFIARMDRGYRK